VILITEVAGQSRTSPVMPVDAGHSVESAACQIAKELSSCVTNGVGLYDTCHGGLTLWSPQISSRKGRQQEQRVLVQRERDFLGQSFGK